MPAHASAPPAMPLLPPERSPIWIIPQCAKNLPSNGLFCSNEFWMFLSSERNEPCSLTLHTDSETGVTMLWMLFIKVRECPFISTFLTF